jgi:hypothetical protein
MGGTAISHEEIPMRSQFFILILASVALTGAIGLASAQSPYSYPRCSRQLVKDGTTTSCYFTNYQQCMTTVSGIGGYCHQSPYYHGPSTAFGQATIRRHRRIQN